MYLSGFVCITETILHEVRCICKLGSAVGPQADTPGKADLESHFIVMQVTTS